MKKILIKNMVCDRCITVVRQQVEALGHPIARIKLGEVEFVKPVGAYKLAEIETALIDHGFELLKGRDAAAVEKVKKLILDHLHWREQKPSSMNFSDYLAKEIGMNYFAISKLFSSTEVLTIEKFLILQKIERVKELLVYNQKSLSEIAFELEYSSVSHLSRQFKSVTGLTPSSFRKLGVEGRRSLDKVCSNNIEVSSPKE